MSIPDRSDAVAFAKYAAGVMLDFAEGKKVQSSLIGCNKWALNLKPTWLWDRLDYRIAPESPAVEPWTFETAPTEARVRRKSDGKLAAVGFYPNEVVIIFGPEDWSSISYLELRDEFEQLDGSPCGVVRSPEGDILSVTQYGPFGGLTKRELFAIKALTVVAPAAVDFDYSDKDGCYYVAKQACQMADALLEALRV